MDITIHLEKEQADKLKYIQHWTLDKVEVKNR